MFYEVDSSEIEESKSTEPAPPAEPWSYSWQGFVGQLKKTSEQFVQVIKEDIQELAVMGEGLVRQMDDSITSAASEQSTTQTAEHSSTSDQTAEQSNAQTEQVEESGSTINKLFGSASSYVTKAEELTTKGFSSAVQYASKAEQLLDNQLSQITNEIKNNLFEKEEIRPVGNRTENSIYDLAKHENTYLKPFDVDQAQMERYFAFRGSFDQIAHAGRIAGLLDQQPKVLYFFQKLVPSKMTDEEFWSNYYFSVSELELQQKVRAQIDIVQEEHLGWSSSEEGDTATTPKATKVVKNTEKKADAKAEPSTESSNISASKAVTANILDKDAEVLFDSESVDKPTPMKPILSFDNLNPASSKLSDTSSFDIIEGGSTTKDNISEKEGDWGGEWD